MTARRRATAGGWSGARPGEGAEALAIALLILALTAVTLVVGARFYLTGLTALSRPGQPVAWLVRPGEAGLILLLSLAGGGWLAGVWLGERCPRRWAGLAAMTALLTLPVLLVLDAVLEATRPNSPFAPPGLTPDILRPLAPAIVLAGLGIGGLLGAWWSGLGPEVGDETEE